MPGKVSFYWMYVSKLIGICCEQVNLLNKIVLCTLISTSAGMSWILCCGLKYYFQSQNTVLYRFHPQLPRWLPVLERRRSPWSSWTNETSGETPTGRAWWYSSSSNRRFLYLAVLFLSTQKELGSRTQTQVYRPVQEWKTHPWPCSASYRSVSPELSSWNQVEKCSVWMEWYWVRHL